MAGTFKIKSADGGYVYIDPASTPSDMHLSLPNAAGTIALNSTFTSATAGLVPASGGNSLDYLSADGTFSRPKIAHVCELRLSLASGTPITANDLTSKNTIYLTPDVGNNIALYTNSKWELLPTSEVSIAVPSATSTLFDIFAYNSSGTCTLETVNWASSTPGTCSRATSLTRQDGVYVQSGSTNKRYLGTGCTTATAGLCEDSLANRLLWNYYNRRTRACQAPLETTDSWTYTTATIRQANANPNNKFNLVIGVEEDPVNADVVSGASNTNAGVAAWTMVGVNSTTSMAINAIGNPVTTPAGGYLVSPRSAWIGHPGLGLNYIAWLEYSDASGTTTWRGDGGLPALRQSGIWGSMRG